MNHARAHTHKDIFARKAYRLRFITYIGAYIGAENNSYDSVAAKREECWHQRY
jgi:hypothetical protein